MITRVMIFSASAYCLYDRIWKFKHTPQLICRFLHEQQMHMIIIFCYEKKQYFITSYSPLELSLYFVQSIEINVAWGKSKVVFFYIIFLIDWILMILNNTQKRFWLLNSACCKWLEVIRHHSISFEKLINFYSTFSYDSRAREST